MIRRPPTSLAHFAFAVAVVLLAAAPAAGQTVGRFSAALLGGLGGSFDADPGPGLTQPNFQLNLELQTDRAVQVGLRLGTLDFGSDEPLGTLEEADLTYLTLAGEYLVQKNFYISGLFLGLGGYRLQGERSGNAEDDTALGFSIGVTGDFRINRSWSIMVEFAGHWADFEEAQIFGLGQVGVAYHF